MENADISDKFEELLNGGACVKSAVRSALAHH